MLYKKLTKKILYVIKVLKFISYQQLKICFIFEKNLIFKKFEQYAFKPKKPQKYYILHVFQRAKLFKPHPKMAHLRKHKKEKCEYERGQTMVTGNLTVRKNRINFLFLWFEEAPKRRPCKFSAGKRPVSILLPVQAFMRLMYQEIMSLILS